MNDLPLATQRIVIAGGTGFVGQSLARHLKSRGVDITILTRTPRENDELARYIQWDGHSPGAWVSELEGADGLINLVGRSVDCIKTPAHCDEILRSRVDSVHVLGQALHACKNPPPVWVQMGTAHIYGDPPIKRCDESSAFGIGLAPTIGRAWENAFKLSRPESIRGVLLRTSFVLGHDGGALERLKFLVRLRLGGTVGNGKQGMSWIHERDMNRIFEHALTDNTMSGAYIASSPNPVSNKEFMKTLRESERTSIGLPAPAWLVRIGAPLVMRTDADLALYGRYVLPIRLEFEGFIFELPTLGLALEELRTHQPLAKPNPLKTISNKLFPNNPAHQHHQPVHN